MLEKQSGIHWLIANRFEPDQLNTAHGFSIHAGVIKLKRQTWPDYSDARNVFGEGRLLSRLRIDEIQPPRRERRGWCVSDIDGRSSHSLDLLSAIVKFAENITIRKKAHDD